LSLFISIHYFLFLAHERQVRLHSGSELQVDIEFINEEFLKWELAITMLQPALLWLVKTAFLFMYWNLTSRGHQPPRRLRYTLYATSALLVAGFVAIMATFLTYCRPLSENWNFDEAFSGHLCSPAWGYVPQTVWISLTIATDLMIIGIPLLIISTIHNNMSRIEKRVLPLIFVVGAVSIAASIIRYTINKTRGFYSTENRQEKLLTLQQYHLVVMLSILEIIAALIAFVMPVFRGLLAQKFWRRRPVLQMKAVSIKRPSGRRREPVVQEIDLIETRELTLAEASVDRHSSRESKDSVTDRQDEGKDEGSD